MLVFIERNEVLHSCNAKTSTTSHVVRTRMEVFTAIVYRLNQLDVFNQVKKASYVRLIHQGLVGLNYLPVAILLPQTAEVRCHQLFTGNDTPKPT